MKIQFINPNKRIEGERRIKIIDKKSHLYKILKYIQSNIDIIVKRSPDRIDLHIELLGRDDNPDDIELQNYRVNKILQFNIDLEDQKNWGFIGKAYCLFIPHIEGYNAIPHITIAYLRDYNITDELLLLLRKHILDTLANYTL